MTCLDTAILIWGIRGFATPGQEHQIDKAERYLRWMRLKNKPIAITTPVLAEYQVQSNATELAAGEIFQRNFQIFPFDIPAAAETAKLLRDLELVKSIMKECNVSKQCIKTDAMILGIAIHRKCERIVTSDFKAFKKLAQGRINVVELPDIQEDSELQQPSLF